MPPAKQKTGIEYHAPSARRAARLGIGLLSVALALCAWRLFFHRSTIDKGLQALQAAYTERPVEARMSGFSYAPFAVRRGAQTFDERARSLAERLLLEACFDQPSAKSHHALGLYYMTERQYDRAIAEFQTALQSDGQNARLYSDLGAALLEKGRAETGEEGRNVEALAAGLMNLNRALTIDSTIAEAIFNRALLRQEMRLDHGAEEDWRAYIEKDCISPWAAEARHNLERLEEGQRQKAQSQKNMVEDFLTAFRAGDEERAWATFSPNREKLTLELLAVYLKSEGRKNESRESLSALAYAGELDIRRAGDRFAADTARFYKSASPQQLVLAGEAHEAMSRARESYGQAQVEKAAELREQARRIFTRIGDVSSARLATYWLALHCWELGRTEQSRSIFDPFLRDCESDHHQLLRARALHYLAGIAFRYREYSRAIDLETESRQAAEKLNDSSLTSSARSALIEYYRQLGNRSGCFREIEEGWDLIGAITLTPTALWRQYDTLATAFDTFGYYDAAIDYEREALKFAVALGDFVTTSSCQTHLSLIYGKAQRFDEAFLVAQQAYDAGAAHSDQALGQLITAYAALHKGHLYRVRGEFDKAREEYDRTIEIHRNHQLNFPTHFYQAYKGRLACYLALKDTAAAQEQMATLFELMDQHRAKIIEEENRYSFFDAEQSVFEMGIELTYSQLQDWRKAFEYAENSRSRSLLDSMSGNPQVVERGGKFDLLLQATAQPLTLAEIQLRIPEDSRLLEYAVLDDKLIVWIVSRNDLKSVAVSISQISLTRLVDEFLAALRSASEAERAETARLGRELFNQLIKPVESSLGDCHKLVIIPDKALNLLPWDALISSDRNRFLVEDYMVMLAPSATLFAICTDLAAQKDDERDERILSVGDPGFDPRAFPKLYRLREAEDEARRIARLYSSSCLLVKQEACESAVRDELARADVTHFAAHCVINERSVLNSCLVLAKEQTNNSDTSERDGRLQTGEIYRLKSPRLRLAVLSACQTGVERYYRGEGMIGMARAFLVARVPVVVANLWPVDSDATTEIMIRFHEYRKQNHSSTAEAMWQAKRSMLQESRTSYSRPFYWAAFEVIGGQANF
jgi:CHAT domain-containing protein